MPHDITERTFNFAVRIVKLYFSLPNEIRLAAPAKQLLRAGTSIGANVEEAQGGLTKKDFIHSINIAKKEARETVYWLKLWIAVKLTNLDEVQVLLNEAIELQKILTAIVKATQTK